MSAAALIFEETWIHRSGDLADFLGGSPRIIWVEKAAVEAFFGVGKREFAIPRTRHLQAHCRKTHRQAYMSTVITQELVNVLRAQFRINWSGIHGVQHWSRVRLFGLRLARETGARTDVVEWFAFLHDAAREDEGFDRGHGERAVALARDLRGPLLPIDDSGFDLLAHAMTHHSDGHHQGDVTVRTCWDADRLDLPRVGIDPDPERLCTVPARRREMIEWARKRAKGR